MLKENSVTYRNTIDFITDDNQTIDQGSLWVLNNNILVLVDDDNYIETPLDLSIFEPSK